MKAMIEFIQTELQEFEQRALVASGQPPLSEDEYDAYAACMAATWGNFALEAMERIQVLVQETKSPETRAILLELGKEILHTLPVMDVPEEILQKFGARDDIPSSGTVH